MPESTASSAHTIFVCPPSGNRIEVTIPPGKLPGDLFTVMLKDEDAYPARRAHSNALAGAIGRGSAESVAVNSAERPIRV